MHLIYSLGETSTWAESIVQSFESTIGDPIVRCPDIAALHAQMAGTGGIPVVLVENGFGSQKYIRALRDSRARSLVIWFGKTFSKEDYTFALSARVYAVLEGISTADSRLADTVGRAEATATSEDQMQHLLRTLKTAVLQRSGEEQETELLGELKTVIAKLEKSSHSNELVGVTAAANGADSRLPLHQSAVLADALLTVSDLERTGLLQIVSRSQELQGSVQFLQGKIVHATSGAVQGLKAIYRMFLWPDVQFQFARQQAIDVNVDDPISMPVRDICVKGEKLLRDFNEIRANVPPTSLVLELEPSVINGSSRLEPDLFSALSSIVEFGHIEKVLDYNELPDVVLYQALIALRRRRLVRVVQAKVA